ncbi:hypothetical protein CCACVL1_00394 [Corchorus capsularis]|uniref:Uncharacterized protein n=1 Tax=Corchorus capsularis TaxID=210143 RepID=A0A1R3KX53_COCAP|nr:hypothetical protein CCACVL1_00394 [Corchorus capsularis]
MASIGSRSPINNNNRSPFSLPQAQTRISPSFFTPKTPNTRKRHRFNRRFTI